ncbi:MAG: ABC transporter permease [Rhizobiales bacterium 24-66-13]|jgi:branched-chain amino acid transport system substrate-binding protein|nr:MAG: ABC transporter permease [Rhizobiales bacterium 35-66-30]OYZ79857.1 MAG: ABC transporter permease [Rhizobiales bacterium 24-66-13]OZB07911.1 MAG: ABC transporter permease [Rhizobiales bacterium 39-66-18]HQS08579.1 ABC transporter substrate-binding protein [Xanthobacteraceae bacterium]HQS45606.1 ABC transporter substrate-binding protein [Xanthobacteraceae bacterium]
MSGPANAAGFEVKIGILTDMSSVFADLVGPGSVLAAQMAIDDFIATEQPDFKISLVSADHQSKADVATATARRWMEWEGVDMVTDIAGASVSLAVSKLAPAMNKLVIATASGQNSPSQEDCQVNLIQWTYNTYATSRITADTVTRQGHKSWYFVTADYAGGRSVRDDAKIGIVDAGGKLLSDSLHPFGTNDFSSFLLKAQGSGADVIAFASAGADTVNSIKQAVEFGLNTSMVMVGALAFIGDINALVLQTARGMCLTNAFYWDRTDATRAWSKRFFDKRKMMPNMAHAGLYSAVRHYLRAVRAADTDDTAAVLAKMRELPVHDMFAENGKLREDDMMTHDVYIWQVKSPAESKYPWDYLKLVKVVPGNAAFRPLSESKCPLVAR